MSGRRDGWRRAGAVLVAAGALVLASACSSSGDGDADSSSPPSTAAGAPNADAFTAEAPSGDAATDAGDSSGGAGASSSADTAGTATGPASGVDPDVAAASAQRQVISTATVVVTVDHLDGSVERARRITAGANGLVFDEQTSREADPETVLTLKVPPAAFDRVIDQLAELGELESKQIATDDVTAQVVDLDSRIATAEASVERLRALIIRAEDIDDIALLESQLLDRETTLESLRGERRTIGDQVALATITVTLQPTPESPDTPAAEPDELPGFLDALQGGWDALLTAGSVVLLAVFALLPWVPLLIGVALVVRFARRRVRRRRAAAGPASPPPGPIAPPPFPSPPASPPPGPPPHQAPPPPAPSDPSSSPAPPSSGPSSSSPPSSPASGQSPPVPAGATAAPGGPSPVEGQSLS